MPEVKQTLFVTDNLVALQNLADGVALWKDTFMWRFLQNCQTPCRGPYTGCCYRIVTPGQNMWPMFTLQGCVNKVVFDVNNQISNQTVHSQLAVWFRSESLLDHRDRR